MSAYPPPTENLPIFDSAVFSTTPNYITETEVNILLGDKVDYPITQGAITLANGSVATTQTSTDNSTKLATTAFVQTAVSAITPATTSYTFTSTASSTTTWSIIMNSATTGNGNFTGEGVKLGKMFQFYLYTGSNPGTYSLYVGGGIYIANSDFGKNTSNTGSPVITTTNNFIASGRGYFLPTNLQKSVISYWQGFQETYTFNQSIYAYDIVYDTTKGNSPSTYSSVVYNMDVDTPVSSPPTISASGYNQLNFTATTPLTSAQTLTLVIVPVA